MRCRDWMEQARVVRAHCPDVVKAIARLPILRVTGRMVMPGF
jgi:hypothetical protein